MQVSLVLTGALVYAGGLAERVRLNRGLTPNDVVHLLAIPAACLALTVAAVLLIPPLRRMIRGHLLASHRTGFGQSVISVVVGLGVIIAAGAFLIWRVQAAARGGPDAAGAFSGFAAGLGLLLAQAVLARDLAREGGPNQG